MLAALAGAARAQAPEPLAPGRLLAATCAPCHGTFGQARGDLPSLAGMPAERIVSVLGGYKSGALVGTLMPQLARGYTDEQIAQVAAWWAAQPAKP